MAPSAPADGFLEGDFRVDDCHLVVGQLDRIVERCRAENDPVGYFAMLYRLTTQKIVRSVDEERFEDNDRMAEMDKNFANRYFDAVSAHFGGGAASAVWQVSFQAAARDEPTVLQHLFLGMNAHIHLDLAAAAAETCPGEAIHDFERDFAEINSILESLFSLVEHDIAKIWHPLRILLPMGERLGNLMLAFAMETERRGAWSRAVELALLEPEARERRIEALDQHFAALGQGILDPGPVLQPLLDEIRREEQGTVAEKIEDFYARGV
ncbi:MAG: DUF5995 family protein [Holophagales bacterium]|nr:DUF5995 family protein [Holophagales bacterium]